MLHAPVGALTDPNPPSESEQDPVGVRALDRDGTCSCVRPGHDSCSGGHITFDRHSLDSLALFS